MPSIHIPTTLRRYTDNESSIPISGASVGEALQSLEQRHPKAFSQICDETGAIRSFIVIFVNDTDIRLLAGRDTPLRDNDEVHIIPAMAGG
jgi:molybdopterin converting factor small subunit